MNNLSKLTSELLFTTVFASIVAVIVALGTTWLLSEWAPSFNSTPYVYFSTGILYGLTVGYKLRDLVQQKPAKKKK